MLGSFSSSKEGDLELPLLPSSRLFRIRKRRRVLWAIGLLTLVLLALFFVPKSVQALAEPPPVSLQVPHSDFVGRKAMLQRLEEALLPNIRVLRSSIPIRVKVLWGIGGVGKSELALKFANDHLSNFSLVWLFHCETEEGVDQGYRGLAERLGIYSDEKTPLSVVKRKVHGHLEEMKGRKPWLLILDNVDRQWKDDELPHRGGSVLITSRQSSVRRNPEECLKVPFFSPEEGEALFLRVTGENWSPEVRKLAKELHYYPLVLNQAAHYIRETPSINVARYLEGFQKKQTLVGVPISEDDRYAHTLQSVWQMTLNKLREENPLAIDFLEICSYFAPENIPIQWLEGAPLFEGKSDEVVRCLAQLALITYNPEKRTFSIHRLMRHLLQEQQLDPKVQMNLAVELLIENAHFDRHHPESWDFEEDWFSHALALEEKGIEGLSPFFLMKIAEWFHITGKYAQVIEHAEKIVDGPQVVLARLYHMKGDAQSCLCHFKQGEQDLRRAAQLGSEAFGEKSSEMGQILISLSTLLTQRGKYFESVEKIDQAIEIFTQSSLEQSKFLVRALLQQGWIFFRLGKNREAIASCERGARLLQELGFPTGRSTLFYAQLSAGAHNYNGNPIVGPGFMAKYKAELERIYPDPENHPVICTYLINNTECLRGLGEYQQGIGFSKRAIDASIALGGGDITLAFAYSNIGHCLLGLGQTEEGVHFHHQALEIIRNCHGEDHIDVARALRRLARGVRELGQYEEALTYNYEAYRYLKRMFPEGHPLLAATCKEIGACLFGLERYEEGLIYSTESLHFWREVHKEEHPQEVKTLQVMGEIYQAMGKDSEALRSLTEGLQVASRVYLPRHPELEMYCTQFAESLSMMEDSEEKRTSKALALSLLKQTLGRFNSQTRKLAKA